MMIKQMMNHTGVMKKADVPDRDGVVYPKEELMKAVGMIVPFYMDNDPRHDRAPDGQSEFYYDEALGALCANTEVHDEEAMKKDLKNTKAIYA